MNNKFIKQLVKASITEQKLDRVKVEKISSYLTRQELKLFIKGLKRWIHENTVVIEVPRGKSDYQDAFGAIFKSKELRVEQNPELLLGVKIRVSDDIYEMSLQNTFRQIEMQILENYDR